MVLEACPAIHFPPAGLASGRVRFITLCVGADQCNRSMPRRGCIDRHVTDRGRYTLHLRVPGTMYRKRALGCPPPL